MAIQRYVLNGAEIWVGCGGNIKRREQCDDEFAVGSALPTSDAGCPGSEVDHVILKAAPVLSGTAVGVQG